MSRLTATLILLAAAGLEAGGDAVMRKALHSNATAMRVAWFALGAVVLTAYGYTVNAPPWDFGQLLGLYVVFFFVVAQALSYFVFGQAPTPAVWIGGLLICAGGAVIAWNAQ